MSFNQKNKKQALPNLKALKAKKEKELELTPDEKPAFNWFPGHMMKALRDIKAKVANVDLVMEIRDARVPTITGNPLLSETIKGKARLIVLNKANLADPVMNEKWEKWFTEQGVPFMFVNCLEKNSMKPLLQRAKSLIEERRRSCSIDQIADKESYKFMIIGLPNTGKSTFINSVANRGAAKVANKPGQTKVQQWVKIDEQMDLLDTPGVMPPQLSKDEHKYWLSIVNALPDHVVGEEDPACHLLRILLKKASPEFMERYKFESVDMDIDSALTHIAKVRGCVKQKGLPDLDRVFKLLLGDFRDGLLGRVTIEQPPLK